MKMVFFVLFILAIRSEAKAINKCGTYQAEGYYTEIVSNFHDKKRKKVILLDRGTNSEIKFFVLNSDIDKLIPITHLGVNFKLKLNFASSCSYACEGKIIEVIQPLSPLENPKPFLSPRPNPIKRTEVKCKPNSIEEVTSKKVSQ
jgi:hypothetical protein